MHFYPSKSMEVFKARYTRVGSRPPYPHENRRDEKPFDPDGKKFGGMRDEEVERGAQQER